jgi:hypothetical protein
MSAIRMRSPRRFSAKRIAFIFSVATLVTPAMATDSGSPLPDLSGQWGRDMLFFEPPPSGPGPVISAVRKADGAIVARDPCCATGNPGGWLGDHTNPILKPEAAAAVKKYTELVVSGMVAADLHNGCWPEPPPFVMALHFAVNTVRGAVDSLRIG